MRYERGGNGFVFVEHDERIILRNGLAELAHGVENEFGYGKFRGYDRRDAGIARSNIFDVFDVRAG